jgi:hypothetical protein
VSFRIGAIKVGLQGSDHHQLLVLLINSLVIAVLDAAWRQESVRGVTKNTSNAEELHNA